MKYSGRTQSRLALLLVTAITASQPLTTLGSTASWNPIQDLLSCETMRQEPERGADAVVIDANTGEILEGSHYFLQGAKVRLIFVNKNPLYPLQQPLVEAATSRRKAAFESLLRSKNIDQKLKEGVQKQIDRIKNQF